MEKILKVHKPISDFFIENENKLSELCLKGKTEILNNNTYINKFSNISEDLKIQLEIFSNFPEDLRKIFSLYLVGGAVRDFVLTSKEINDLDIYVYLNYELHSEELIINNFNNFSQDYKEKIIAIIIDEYLNNNQGLVRIKKALLKSEVWLNIFNGESIENTILNFKSLLSNDEAEGLQILSNNIYAIKSTFISFIIEQEYLRQLKKLAIIPINIYNEMKASNSELSIVCERESLRYLNDSSHINDNSKNIERIKRFFSYKIIRGLKSVIKFSKCEKFNFNQDILIGTSEPVNFLNSFDFNISQMLVPINKETVSDVKCFINEIKVTEDCNKGINNDCLFYEFFIYEDYFNRLERYKSRIEKMLNKYPKMNISFRLKRVDLFKESTITEPQLNKDLYELEKIKKVVSYILIYLKMGNVKYLTENNSNINIVDKVFKL